MGNNGFIRASSTALPLLIFLLELIRGQAKATNRSRAPALIVFGDSIVDPGNNNEILTTVRCNFPPYGKDFVEHKATGRFSNGKIPSDIIGKRGRAQSNISMGIGFSLHCNSARM